MGSSTRWRLLTNYGICDWHEALTNVSLEVPKGDIVGIIGRNGAGKSTLLRTLAGIYPLAAGRVLRVGPISSLFELGSLGSLFITGHQYITRWLRLNGIPRSQWKDSIAEIGVFSELGERLNDRIYTYSSGMAARLFFATATSMKHEIYLIDEVLSVGDEHFQAKCWKRIRDRLSNGVSGVLVTHDWSAILRLCERTHEIEYGKIKASGDSEKIICDYLGLTNQMGLSREASFAISLPRLYYGTSGIDWACDIPIEIKSHNTVLFNFSIEKLIPGKEWQILFFGTEAIIGSSPGNYLAHIKIPRMPLPAGEYRFNIFLSGPKPSDGVSSPAYDICSWTTGNGLLLSIKGDQSPGLILMPIIGDL